MREKLTYSQRLWLNYLQVSSQLLRDGSAGPHLRDTSHRATSLYSDNNCKPCCPQEGVVSYQHANRTLTSRDQDDGLCNRFEIHLIFPLKWT
jgi:hypothetical protein